MKGNIFTSFLVIRGAGIHSLLFSYPGNAWWTNEIKDAVEGKKGAYKKMLQRNLPEAVRARRKSEYKEWKKRVRELIRESKRKVDEEFGRKFSQNFCENKKLFWKEVKKARGGERDGGCEDEGRGWKACRG